MIVYVIKPTCSNCEVTLLTKGYTGLLAEVEKRGYSDFLIISKVSV